MAKRINSEPQKSKYEARYRTYKRTIEDLWGHMKHLLDDLSSQKDIRAMVTEGRVKEPPSVIRKCVRKGCEFPDLKDIIGLRIVCNNLKDISQVHEIIAKHPRVKKIEVDRWEHEPSNDGYRARHLIIDWPVIVDHQEEIVHCEIQVRTLFQDAWAKLSHSDLYNNLDPKYIPRVIKVFMRSLSDQLYSMDQVAQVIREELQHPVPIQPGPPKLDPPGLGKIFKKLYGVSLKWLDAFPLFQLIVRLGYTDINQLQDVLKTKANLKQWLPDCPEDPVEEARFLTYFRQFAAAKNEDSLLEGLRLALKDDDSNIRRYAVKSLGYLGNPQDFRIVMDAFLDEHENTSVRAEAVAAIPKFPTSNRPMAVKPLRARLIDDEEDLSVRVGVMRTLDKLGETEFIKDFAHRVDPRFETLKNIAQSILEQYKKE